MTAQPVTDRLDAQGVLKPGESGLWKVWGARARHIQPGDYLMLKWGDEVAQHVVADVDHSEPIAARVTAVDGTSFRVGALQPIVLLREDTHNLLAR